MTDEILLLILAVFAVLWITGFFHAVIIDGWRPWKHGWKWWK